MALQNLLPRLFRAVATCLLAGLLCACAQSAEPVADSTATDSPASATPAPSFTPPASATPSPAPTRSPTPRPSPTQRPSPTAAGTVDPISRERIEAPILLYHHVAAERDSKDTYTVTTAQFRAQMQLLKDDGYQAVTMTTLAAALRGETALPDHPVLIAFDDGYMDVYDNAYPLLAELGYPATFYVIVKTLAGPSYVDGETLRELVQAGWEIGSHSLTHADLTKAGDPIGEICTSKRKLEEILGQKIYTFAYPYGAANPYVIQIVKDCKYTSAGGVGPLTSHTPKSILFLSRVTVDGAWTLEQFKTALRGEALAQ